MKINRNNIVYSLVVVALLCTAAVSSAQLVPASQALARSLECRQPVTYTAPQSFSPAKNVATVDVADYSSGYLWSAYQPERGMTGNVSGSGTLTKVTADSVTMYGFFKLANVDMGGKVSGDTIYLSPSQVASSTTYGNAALRRFVPSGKTYVCDSVAPVRFVMRGGKLRCIDYAALVLLDGSGKGIRITYISAPFDAWRVNGVMEVTYHSSSPARTESIHAYPVNITQSGNEVSIQNFSNYGVPVVVTATLKSDSSAVIPKQLVFFDMDYGDFYTYAADFSRPNTSSVKDYISADSITCKAGRNFIEWGNWMIVSDDYMYQLGLNAKVSFTGDGIFTLPTAAVTSIAAPKQVVATRYVGLSGITSSHPWPGVNVKVTRYSDGSTATVKEIYR